MLSPENQRIPDHQRITVKSNGLPLNQLSSLSSEYLQSYSLLPDELQDKATSLNLDNANRNQFIAEILKQLFKIIDEDFIQVLVEYKNLSCVLNKNIEFTIKGQLFTGIVKDINDHGNLVVECNDQELILSSGEVSIVGGNYGTK